MEVQDLPIEGLKLINLKRYKDDRGYFFESFNENKFNTAIVESVGFVQDNVSYSRYNVLRGLHYQMYPKAQGKYVQVLKGRVLDVAVDLRPYSDTFTKWYSVVLTESNGLALYIPPGFAHGFKVLSMDAIFMYKVTEYYDPALDRSLRWDDTDLNIDWGNGHPNLSKKDNEAPYFKDMKEELINNYSTLIV